MKDPVSARAKQLDFIIAKLMDKKTFFITIGLVLTLIAMGLLWKYYDDVLVAKSLVTGISRSDTVALIKQCRVDHLFTFSAPGHESGFEVAFTNNTCGPQKLRATKILGHVTLLLFRPDLVVRVQSGPAATAASKSPG